MIKMRILILISLITLVSCSGQEKESYWKTEELERISGEPMHGVTLAYMETIFEENIHIKKYNDSLQFHYPFKKKVKTSELKSISNFKLFKDYDRVLDSVYDVSIENGELKIKFYYFGIDNKDNQFFLSLKEINKEEYFENIKKIENKLKTIKEEIKRTQEKIKPFDFKQLNLEVIKPEYFNEKDLTIISENNQSIKTQKAYVDLSNISSGHKEYNADGFSIEFSDPKLCAAKYKGISFQGIEYLVNDKDKKASAIVLLKEEALTSSEILNLFKKINSENKSSELYVFCSSGYFEIEWESESKTIKLVIEDFPSSIEVESADFNYDDEKKFKFVIKLIEKSKIRLYIVTKELDTFLKSRETTGWKTGNIDDY